MTDKNIVQIIGEIAAKAGALAPEKSGGVPFPFRGIDATINHVSPLLNEYGVFSTSRVTDKTVTGREINGGKMITQTDITVEYTFHAPDGSNLSTEVAGLAQDYADRSTSQAQSVAYRVALLQLFHLPTQDKEPEERGEETQRVIAKAASEAPVGPKAETVAMVKGDIASLSVNKGSTAIRDAGNKFFGTENAKDWSEDLGQLVKWREHLLTGEVE